MVLPPPLDDHPRPHRPMIRLALWAVGLWVGFTVLAMFFFRWLTKDIDE